MEISKRVNIARVVQERGWVVFNENFSKSADFNEAFPELFTAHPLELVPHMLCPYDLCNAPPASMSAIIGLEAQPPHTDKAFLPRPPRYILLQCLCAGESSCPTHVWALDWNNLLADKPNILFANNWLIKASSENRFYGSVIENGLHMVQHVRFDPLCMTPPPFVSSINEALKCITDYSKMYVIEYSAGDCLLLDNWRVLHGRGSGAALSPSRRLKRWISRIGVINGLGSHNAFQ